VITHNLWKVGFDDTVSAYYTKQDEVFDR